MFNSDHESTTCNVSKAPRRPARVVIPIGLTCRPLSPRAEAAHTTGKLFRAGRPNRWHRRKTDPTGAVRRTKASHFGSWSRWLIVISSLPRNAVNLFLVRETSLDANKGFEHSVRWPAGGRKEKTQSRKDLGRSHRDVPGTPTRKIHGLSGRARRDRRRDVDAAVCVNRSNPACCSSSDEFAQPEEPA